MEIREFTHQCSEAFTKRYRDLQLRIAKLDATKPLTPSRAVSVALLEHESHDLAFTEILRAMSDRDIDMDEFDDCSIIMSGIMLQIKLVEKEIYC